MSLGSFKEPLAFTYTAAATTTTTTTSGGNLRINIKNKYRKCLQGINFSQLTLINFSQLTLTKKTEIKNLGRATIDLFLIHRQEEHKFLWESLTLLYMLNVSCWVAVLKETLC